MMMHDLMYMMMHSYAKERRAGCGCTNRGNRGPVWTNSHDRRQYRNARHRLRADLGPPRWSRTFATLARSAPASGDYLAGHLELLSGERIICADIWSLSGRHLADRRASAGLAGLITRTCSGTLAATSSPTTGTILVRCNTTSVIRTSSTPSDIPSWPSIDSRIIGGDYVC
jgi:hypothetical protein